MISQTTETSQLPSRRSPTAERRTKLTLRLGWLFAVLGFVLCGELGFKFGVASETLRIRSIVFLAPVALPLELGGDFAITLSANRFRHAVLSAPIPGMIVTVRFGCRLLIMSVPAILDLSGC